MKGREGERRFKELLFGVGAQNTNEERKSNIQLHRLNAALINKFAERNFVTLHWCREIHMQSTLAYALELCLFQESA